MQTIYVTIRQIGNSHGFVVPKPLLTQAGLEGGADLSIENGALVLRKPLKTIRQGWAQSAREITQHNDDALVMGEFANDEDVDLQW